MPPRAKSGLRAKRPDPPRANSRKTRTAKSSIDDLKARLADLKSELKEARQQQTATADLLKTISRSAFDLQAVLDALVRSAGQLCGADSGIIRQRDGELFPLVAAFGLTRQQRDRYSLYRPKPDRTAVFGRAILEKHTVHVTDLLTDPELDPSRRKDYAGAIGIRSGLGVPLMHEGTVVGVFALQRRAAGGFTAKQIELVETFANQAVIAIENSRLLSELRETLQQQTATAEVLKVISSSPGELDPVFQSLLANATRICEANFGILFRWNGDHFNIPAFVGAPPDFMEALQSRELRLGEATASGLAARTREVVHIEDLRKFANDSG